MAAGEYVSVSSQADTRALRPRARAPRSSRRIPRRSTASSPRSTSAAASIPGSPSEVATQLAAKDALAAHARDELGITEALRARPIQAALASAAAFAAGAALPLVTALLAPAALVMPARCRALARLPRGPRRHRGARRRRERREGRAARHFLGRDRHGDHGGDRPRLRRRRLRRAPWLRTRSTIRSGIR